MKEYKSFIQYGVVLDEVESTELFDTQEEAEQARSTDNGKLPLVVVASTVLDWGDYEEPTDG